MEHPIKRIRSMVLGETLLLQHDYTERLTYHAAGTTITSAQITMSVRYGTDANVGTMLQGTVQILGDVVQQLVTNGVAATLYLVEFKAACSDGTTLIEERLMEVTQYQDSHDDFEFETSDLP